MKTTAKQPAKKRVRKPRAKTPLQPIPVPLAPGMYRDPDPVDVWASRMLARVRTVIPWIVARSKELSTWRGIIVVTGGCGSMLSPHLAKEILTACGVAIGLIEVGRNETPTPPQS